MSGSRGKRSHRFYHRWELPGELLFRTPIGELLFHTQIVGGNQADAEKDSKISFLNSAANLLYVSANGALGFTAPNATAYPAGFIQGAFTATFDTSPDGSGRFYFLELTSTEEVTALDWLACPISKKGPWQVFVDFEWLADDDVPGNCVEECEKFNATTIVKYPLVSGEQWVYQYD